MDITRKAREFAIKAHGEQTYGSNPYVYHLDKVASVLSRFNENRPVLVSSAYLHDVLEDTPVAPEVVKDVFGPEVFDIVCRVTNKEGTTKEEGKILTFKTISESPAAVAVKLADRIANVEESFLEKGRLYHKYCKEHSLFTSLLDDGKSYREMWNHLNSLLVH
jgi:(p)ppGpp synthase/HD superfamily hydrolase